MNPETKIEQHQTYLDVKGHVSASGMKEALRSPKHYMAFQDAPHEEKPAFVIGTAVHMKIMEPEKFGDEYCYIRSSELPFPDKDFRNKDNKDFRATFLMGNEGKVVLSENQWIEVDVMTKNAMDNKMVQGLFEKDFTVEQSHYFDVGTLNGVEYNMKGKMRTDYLHDELPIFVDIKTTVDASPKGFLRMYNNFKYQLQMAWYFDMLNKHFKEVEEAYILAVENKYPYMAQIYRISEDDLQYGRYMYTCALDRIKRAEEGGYYPGYEVYAGFEDDGSITNNGVLELKTPGPWVQEYVV